MAPAPSIERHRTAMARAGVSRPIAIAIDDGLIDSSVTFFDYGCGRGDDVARLRQLDIDATGWDPAFFPDVERRRADVVNLGYVLNVIENPNERVTVLRDVWGHAQRVLIVSARLTWEAPAVKGVEHADGILTTRGTFQKFFTHEELRDFVEKVLEVRTVTAAPGVFYAFRSQQHAQEFVAARIRHDSSRASARIGQRLFDANRDLLEELRSFSEASGRLPAPEELPGGQELLIRFGSIKAAFAVVRQVTGQIATRAPRASERAFAANRELLDELVHFLTDRGRPPGEDELPAAPEIVLRFGSLRAATRLVERVLGADGWTDVQEQRRADLRVYLGLAAFGGRPLFRELPVTLQRDVKAFFGSYKEACAGADELLFAAGDSNRIDEACRAATVGKLTQEALYVHHAAVGLLPPILRVFEGCARVLAGSLPGATLVKLSRAEAKISYLAYESFDENAHPALRAGVVVNLPRLRVDYRDYSQRANPPILHRKELFVDPDYPLRTRFERLTRQEERAGLLEDSHAIGTRQAWDERLRTEGYRVVGHRLLADATP